MSRTKTSDKLLEAAAQALGYETSEDMLEAATGDTMAPGVCRNCGDVVDEIESDASNYTCENCEQKTVDSVLIVAELV